MPDPEPLAFTAADFDLPDDTWHFAVIEGHPTLWVYESQADIYRCGRTWGNGDRCDTIHAAVAQPYGGRCQRRNIRPVGGDVDGSKPGEES